VKLHEKGKENDVCFRGEREHLGRGEKPSHQRPLERFNLVSEKVNVTRLLTERGGAGKEEN